MVVPTWMDDSMLHCMQPGEVVINFDHDDDWILADDGKTLADYGLGLPTFLIVTVSSVRP